MYHKGGIRAYIYHFIDSGGSSGGDKRGDRGDSGVVPCCCGGCAPPTTTLRLSTTLFCSPRCMCISFTRSK